jgi:hypothetical protein
MKWLVLNHFSCVYSIVRCFKLSRHQSVGPGRLGGADPSLCHTPQFDPQCLGMKNQRPLSPRHTYYSQIHYQVSVPLDDVYPLLTHFLSTE